MRKLFGVGINDLKWSNDRNCHSEYEVRVYSLWSHMLHRCYSEKYHMSRPTYVGCKVCERWKTISQFASDIKKLEGYQDWLHNPGRRYALDKDIKVKGNKIYSPATCKFVTLGENVIEARARRVMVSYSTKDAIKVIIFPSATKAAEVIGVPMPTVNLWLNGKNKGYLKHNIVKISYL